MNKYDNRFPLTSGMNPWLSIPVIILVCMGAAIILSQMAIPLIDVITNINGQELQLLVNQETLNDKDRLALFIFQGFTAIGGFIVGPIIFILLMDRLQIKSIINQTGLSLTPVLLTIIIVLCFMVVISVVLKWNMELTLPEFLKNAEDWARNKEDEIAQLTRNLTVMNNGTQLLIALVVIALIPSIGEELLFRGLIQNKLYAGIGNIHLAIWITGFVFSAIHLQFFGFFPRMFLGVLFGYLYFWSGNLIVPMIAHFVNNAFTILALYLYQNGMIDFNIDQVPTATPISTFIIFLVISLTLIWYFYHFYKRSRVELTE